MITSLESLRDFFASRTGWCVNTLTDINDNHCAVGHLIEGGHVTNMWEPTCRFDAAPFFAPLFKAYRPGESEAVFKKYYPPLSIDHTQGWTALVDINNGQHPDYQQSDPQSRVLAAIDDLIRMRDIALDKVEMRPLTLTQPSYV